jgi:hypothetical protein
LRRSAVLIGALLVCSTLFPQQVSHDVSVVNVEIPVRVFKGDAFVDSLTLGDFEVYEDGVLQTLDAVYLIRKTAVERKEETKAFSPETSRFFYLFFEFYEYHPKIRDAVNEFVRNVLNPGDHLVLATPMKTYELKKEILAGVPKEKIAETINGLVRRDILIGNSAYRRAFNDLKRLVADKTTSMGSIDPEQESMGEGSLEEYFMQYRTLLQRLESLRVVDEKKLLDFAEYLKAKQGQKFVFVFYQREFIPVMDRKEQAKLFGEDVITDGALGELFDFYRRNTSFNTDRIKKVFAAASITIHFLMLTAYLDDIPSTQRAEHSEDVIMPFTEMAKATGGLTASSANAAAMMEKASRASENYYLLYYTPKNKTPDGRFREIKVNVKTGSYRVTHRAGYYLR